MHHQRPRWLRLLAVCSVAFVPVAGVAETDLCPVATKRLNRSVAYQRSDNVISAPATAAETSALLTTLRTVQGDTRMFAIMRLGLAGNLEAFRTLLASADVDGLFVYSGQYLNADDSVCIDPELERALLEHLGDRKLDRALVALLGKNVYRSEAVLAALRTVSLAERQTNRYYAFGSAVTATHLPDIEAQVLAHARSLLPFDDPWEKYESPGLHQHYAKFFTQRHYVPAAGYFRELLAEASREEPQQSFQIKYGMLRTVVLRGLAALGGADAESAIVAELQDIASRPLDAFAASELQTIGQLAPSLAEPKARDDMVEAFERVLAQEQPARYDYEMRRTVYDALAKLATPRAAGLLIAELRGYLGQQPRPNRGSALARIFEALRNMEGLDVAPLIAVIGDVKRSTERRSVWAIVAAHPSQVGVDFLLDELRLSLSGGAEAERLLGAEADVVLLNTLVAVEATERQHQIRDGLDALLDEGVLNQADYLAAVSKLNKALGNESPRYVALRDEQRRNRAREQAARQDAAEREARRELQASFATELARHSSAGGIARNIALLGRGKQAAQWLIIVGEPALPQLHEALAAPDSSGELKVRLLNVIGEIGSVASVDHVIRAASSGADGGLHRSAFFALALIPSTPTALAYAESQLADGGGEARQVSALIYLAQIRHPGSSSLVSRFTADGVPAKVRSAGFYLGARLGTPGIAGRVAVALAQSTDRAELEALLQSLAEAAPDVAEFESVATGVGFGEPSFSYRQSLAYCAFRTAADGQKVELAYRVLAEGGSSYRREAMRYLIGVDHQGTVDRLTGGIGQFMPLHMLLPQSGTVQLLFSESRRMGYTLELTDEGYVLTPVAA